MASSSILDMRLSGSRGNCYNYTLVCHDSQQPLLLGSRLYYLNDIPRGAAVFCNAYFSCTQIVCSNFTIKMYMYDIVYVTILEFNDYLYLRN